MLAYTTCAIVAFVTGGVTVYLIDQNQLTVSGKLLDINARAMNLKMLSRSLEHDVQTRCFIAKESSNQHKHLLRLEAPDFQGSIFGPQQFEVMTQAIVASALTDFVRLNIKDYANSCETYQ